MSPSPVPIFDADHHYYEAPDVFTRHVPREFHHRCVQTVEFANGRTQHLIAGKVDHQVQNPTFNPISRPGVLQEYYKGNPEGKSFTALVRSNLEPLPAAYMDREARLEQLDAQGVDGAWLFPTAGILYEEPMRRDLEARLVMFRGFNRWLDEDWGFAYENRIFAAPYITFSDPAWMIEELEWAIDKGARVLVTRPAPALTREGSRSPGDPMFDDFWKILSETGIPLIAHVGNSGYTTHGYPGGGMLDTLGGGRRPSIGVYKLERAILDWFTALVFDRVLERFPGVRIGSVENGAAYLHDLFRVLRSARDRYPRYFEEDPVESFREHAYINPFWEDDIDDVIEFMGVNRVLCGSDFPHMEGLEEPRQLLTDISHLAEADQHRVVYANAAELTGISTPATV